MRLFRKPQKGHRNQKLCSYTDSNELRVIENFLQQPESKKTAINFIMDFNETLNLARPIGAAVFLVFTGNSNLNKKM